VSRFFVTGAGTEIGKTYVACALLRAWRAQGLQCGALKPVVSGFDEATRASSDPALLLAAAGGNADEIARIAPWRYRAPLAPPLAAKLEGETIDFEAVAGFCAAGLREARERLLIEGAGGVMAPLTEGRTNLDLIARLRLPVLFVAGSYLGAVSHALTGLACLGAEKLAVAAVIVSESAESVGLTETCAMIGEHRPDLRIAAAPRSGEGWARSLATALAQGA
jgi:dethiobiotin synthetase